MHRRFLYFLPGWDSKQGKPNGFALSMKSVADRFWPDQPDNDAVGDYDVNHVQNGPAGESGALIASRYKAPGSGLLYEPDKQEWRRFHSFWLGWEKAKQPGPADLERPDMLPSTPLTLGDDNEWRIPVAELRPMVEQYSDGAWRRVPDPRHDELWRFAEELRPVWETVNQSVEAWQAAMEAAAVAVDASDRAAKIELAQAAFVSQAAAMNGIDTDAAVTVLGRNYRIGREEVSAMGLLATDAVNGKCHKWQILDTLMDGPGIRLARAGKKNDTPG